MVKWSPVASVDVSRCGLDSSSFLIQPLFCRSLSYAPNNLNTYFFFPFGNHLLAFDQEVKGSPLFINLKERLS